MASDLSDGKFTRIGLRGMREEKDCRSLHKLFSIVAAFIDRSTECEKKAPMIKLHVRFCNIVSDMKRDDRQRAWGGNNLRSMETRVKKFKKRLVDTFDKHYDSGLYFPTNHPLDHKTKIYE